MANNQYVFHHFGRHFEEKKCEIQNTQKALGLAKTFSNEPKLSHLRPIELELWLLIII